MLLADARGMGSRVTRTVWLAAYPKSGKTWLRVFIANLSATGAPADINALTEHGLISSGRHTQNHAHGTSPDRGSASETCFINAYTSYTAQNEKDSVHRDVEGAIVIVRDPRDIAPSLAAYSRNTIDDAIAFMDDPDALPAPANGPSRPKLPRWSQHVAGWLEQKDIPVHLVRYEDLVADPFTSFRRALRFSGTTIGDDIIRRAVSFSDFKKLRAQEIAKGFQEAQPSMGRLFRRGVAGSWHDELTAAQTARIEANHGAMMQRLGYTLSSQSKITGSTR
jgi:aryl sulfotransferase